MKNNFPMMNFFIKLIKIMMEKLSVNELIDLLEKVGVETTKQKAVAAIAHVSFLMILIQDYVKYLNVCYIAYY